MNWQWIRRGLLGTLVTGAAVAAGCSDDPATTSGGSSGQGEGCPSSQTECGDVCVDTDTDRLHCGECDVACADGEVCDGSGMCAVSCQTGLTQCDGTCTNTNSDNQHCGDCATVCGAGEVCDGAGMCAVSCQAGLTDCSGTCVNTDSDNANCGGCNAPCDPGEVCDGNGMCALSCQTGLTDCGGTCTNTDSDNLNCGGCNAPCDPGDVCTGGMCVLSCQNGLTDCSGTCTNTDTDNLNCGGCNAPCGPGEVCNGMGQCAVSCQPGLVNCGGTCINPASDGDFCGAGPNCAPAGVNCTASQACVNGTCTALGGGCLPGDVSSNGGCLLTTVCGDPVQQVYASANCSDNTAEFADWWCQLGGYAGALSYTEVTSGGFNSHYYNGGAEEVLSNCNQVLQSSYGFDGNCTGVNNLVCIPTPISNALRSDLNLCGTSSRPVTQFIPPGANLDVVNSCNPTINTQAMLISRNGTIPPAEALRTYLNGGGIVLTEWNYSDNVWNQFLPDVSQGVNQGSCLDNLPHVVQFTPADPVWQGNTFTALPAAQSGCGYAIQTYPQLVPIAGWTATNVSVGYRNIGRGRIWVTDFDWQDTDTANLSALSLSLMRWFVSHRR
jgi:hypothetical protein